VNQYFFLQLSLCGTHGIYLFSSTEHCAWAIISPKEFKILGHAHIICITVRDNRIICCQIFCDLLLKSAFERIFNVMQLILIKIKWHIKWKYLIKTFHDIGLSYYFKTLHNEHKSEVIVYNWLVCHYYYPKNTSATVLQRQPPFSNYSFYNIYTTWHGYYRKPFFCLQNDNMGRHLRWSWSIYNSRVTWSNNWLADFFLQHVCILDILLWLTRIIFKKDVD